MYVLICKQESTNAVKTQWLWPVPLSSSALGRTARTPRKLSNILLAAHAVSLRLAITRASDSHPESAEEELNRRVANWGLDRAKPTLRSSSHGAFLCCTLSRWVTRA